MSLADHSLWLVSDDDDAIDQDILILQLYGTALMPEPSAVAPALVGLLSLGMIGS
jgi:hypothetical protein